MCLTLCDVWMVRHSNLKLSPGNYINFNYSGDPRYTISHARDGRVLKERQEKQRSPRPGQTDYALAVGWTGERANYWLNLLGYSDALELPMMWEADFHLFLTWKSHEVRLGGEGRWPFPALRPQPVMWQVIIMAILKLEGGADEKDLEELLPR